MFNKSIAYRLSIYISLAVVTVFMAFIIVNFIYNQKIVIDSIDDKAKGKSIETIGFVRKQINATQEIANLLSDQFLYYAEHDDEELILNSIMERFQFLNSIYVRIDSVNGPKNQYSSSRLGLGDSIIFNYGNEVLFSCNEKVSTFKELELSEIAKWSNVYSCDSNQIISYYSPLLNNSSIKVGSIICEISLKTLNDSVNNLKIEDSGYAFIVDEHGVYLTHPDPEFRFNRSLFALPEGSYDKSSLDINTVLNNKLSGTTIGYPEYLNYKKCVVHYTPIVETGWFLLILIPYDELYQPVYILILRMLFISVLGILIIYFIVSYITNKQIQPLSNVTTQLKKFSNLSGETDLNTLNEVKIVSESLDAIRSWYEKYKIDQSKEKKLSRQQKLELLEASEIQMSLINTDFSAFKSRNDIDLYAIYKPARIVSGDLFDFFFIDKEHLFFSIGDVSGKGISAAFFMSVAQTIIKSNAKLKIPEKIVYQVNNELTTANQHQFFLTLFVGILNLKTGLLNYCNAAHTMSLIVNPNGETTILRKSHGMPLGLYSNKKYTGASININKGDTIFIYTDGVTELMNDRKEQFGIVNLENELQKLSDKDPITIVEGVNSKLNDFKGKNSQSDDISIMALNYKA